MPLYEVEATILEVNNYVFTVEADSEQEAALQVKSAGYFESKELACDAATEDNVLQCDIHSTTLLEVEGDE